MSLPMSPSPSGLKHITLHRESQMGIPHITAVDLEQHLQNMKTNRQNQPTVNKIVEAQQPSEELASKTGVANPLPAGIFLPLKTF
jgi:hypothetical protein